MNESELHRFLGKKNPRRGEPVVDKSVHFPNLPQRGYSYQYIIFNLVVADLSRTEKTICLAVSPSLKAYGIPGRARLFEVVQKVKEVNAKRLSAYRNYLKQRHNPDYKTAQLGTESFNATALASDPSAKLGYIVAPPRMQR